MEIKNVSVTIPGETIGSLVVECDIMINQEEDTASHPDSMIKNYVSDIQVTKIRMVEFQVFDSVGVVMTSRFESGRLRKMLENQIIEEVECKSVSDLKIAS